MDLLLKRPPVPIPGLLEKMGIEDKLDHVPFGEDRLVPNHNHQLLQRDLRLSRRNW